MFNREYMTEVIYKICNKLGLTAYDYFDTDFIIPVDKDKQIVKILEGKSVIIQVDTLIKPETIELLKEDIQKQIKENGFAVVNGKYKIFEFNNPKYLIETK